MFSVDAEQRQLKVTDFHVPHDEEASPELRQLRVEAIFSFPELDSGDTAAQLSVPEFFRHMTADDEGSFRVRIVLEAEWTDDGTLNGTISSVLRVVNTFDDDYGDQYSDFRDRNRIQAVYVPATRDGAKEVSTFLRGRIWRAGQWSPDFGAHLSAPDGITVADLVARGRYPHQRLIRQWTDADEKAVVDARHATGTTELSGRLVDELSGGQRQRVWVAMTLAQETPILLLDEPTTFFDITHQIELLELFTDLQQAGRTLVAVLHDLNHAARYATHLIAMKNGSVVAEGPPQEIVTPELVRDVFDLECLVVPDLFSGTPQVVPLGRTRTPAPAP